MLFTKTIGKMLCENLFSHFQEFRLKHGLSSSLLDDM